jgi:SAM-dependent methyltransferase
MLPGDTDKHWEQFGAVAPYYGVLSADKYRPEQLDAAAIDDFFGSGEQHIDRVISIVQRQIDAQFAPQRCLDFGCGVGRLVIPLAQRYAEVVGVDISPAMLAEAQRNCTERGLHNVTFVQSDDHLARVAGTFDFVHSFIVLQHINQQRGLRLLRQLIERLNPNGVGAIQLTYHIELTPMDRWKDRLQRRIPLLYKIVNVINKRPLNHPYMLMHRYDLNAVFQIVQTLGCSATHVEFSSQHQNRGVFLFFRKAPAQLF